MNAVLAQLDAVSFSYRRGQPVIEEFDARFDGGTVYAVTGASGCGKSTVLSLLGLLLKPTAGEVRLRGQRCTKLTDAQRSGLRRHQIGFVFQDALLEPSMTVWQSLLEGLPPRAPRSPALARAHEAVERLALPRDILSRKAISLSGGQAQRVAVIRALLKEPSIVLADEPTGNLDAESGKIVLDYLTEYAQNPERACVIVTHDDRVVARADHVVRLIPR